MLRFKFGIIILLFSAFIISSPIMGYAEETQFIDTSAYESLTQPRVQFFHDLHNENAGLEECSICHHVYEDGVISETESSEDSSCSECHTSEMFSKKTTTLTSAFHKSCKACHLKEKAGPVMCGECHKRDK